MFIQKGTLKSGWAPCIVSFVIKNDQKTVMLQKSESMI